MPSSHAAYSVFISSSPEDKESAGKLFHALTQAGIKVWFEKESLLPGQKRDVAIQNAIRDSRFFLVLLSSHSVKRGQVNKEVARALEQIDEFPESDIFIIPVRLDQCSPSHEKLGELVMTDLFPDWGKGVEKILQAIRTQVNEHADTVHDNPPNAEPFPDVPPVQNRQETTESGAFLAVPSNQKEKPRSLVPALAVVLVILMFFVIARSLLTTTPVFLEISGNVRFVQEGKPIGSVYGATVSPAGVSGHRTETDKNGNFHLKIPDDRQMQKIELMAEYQSETQYKKIQRTELGNVIMEIPKQPEVKFGAGETDSLGKTGADVKIEGNHNRVNISGGDMTISGGN